MNTLNNLKNQFGHELSRNELQTIVGGVVASGSCGVFVQGHGWMQTIDANGNGTTKEETLSMFDEGMAYYQGEWHVVTGWCCDSCPWNL